MICGIDLGSRSVKLVLMAEGAIREKYIFETIAFYREFGRKTAGELQVDFTRMGLAGIDRIVTTGYGRNTLKIHNSAVIPELKAHVLGAVWQTGLADFTLLDLGGQDSKVILVRNGKMKDFLTNDKCAASTGRYLENMAAVLGMGIDELSRYSDDPVELTSTCAIFGESELISKIVDGYSPAALAAGVNYSIFKRIRPMLNSLASANLVFTGGVANNQALRRIIARETGITPVVPPLPQFNGAIGCAVHGAGREEQGES